MSAPAKSLGPAIDRVIAGIGDAGLRERYPNRTHFIDADNPDKGLLTSRALFAGDPAVVIYADGHEVLFTPERAHGLASVLLLMALLWMRLRERSSSGELIQLPPRTHVEVRDASGLPRAA